MHSQSRKDCDVTCAFSEKETTANILLYFGIKIKFYSYLEELHRNGIDYCYYHGGNHCYYYY